MEHGPGKWFFLKPISYILRAFGGPDWQYLISMRGGVLVGVDDQMPRGPDVFEAKTLWALDEAPELPVHERGNYKSVGGFEDRVEELFELEHSLGWMECATLETAKARYGDRLFIASLAVVDEGAKIRQVHG